jgi:hypothetical protein
VWNTEFLCNSSRSSCARMPADSMRCQTERIQALR